MTIRLPVQSPEPPAVFTASGASRYLCRPTSQILRAVRSIPLESSRLGEARNAAILLAPADLVQIEEFLNHQTQSTRTQ